MKAELRIANLKLLRYLYGSQNDLVSALAPRFSAVTIKGMVGGYTTITDVIAEEIEIRLNLPTGWINRDNENLIQMSALNYEIQEKISAMPPTEKQRLKDLISDKW